ncbi:lipid-A-disaccharide synthase N-terminal domain-containing protein [Gramella sp. GC03-9]|uniref:Lipid-A-disaccharide synthase N-terminal domain-containing protein n=1 Tax=Christiangramia oceanisediminis TaxID=2920386 RepID=A0A9X2KYE8_9FLAO|nr:lipid-A-disaccharide synthase N-terminal domain-containing protein [Gramella oceanisediminis]MCP9200511.1 lipid-A-disaccharide synthase N-terminal domain-containing protein [Gramella oceanisediminis]
MSSLILYSLGFSAQILFSGRMIFQWVLSEKSKKLVTPALFWYLSLLASFLLFVYGYFRNDFAIMFGQTLTYFIYIRNLQLQGEWNRIPKLMRWFLWIFPLLIVFYGFNNHAYDARQLFRNENIPIWLLILGSFAQFLFNLRFFYQWIYSEKRKISRLPMGFWVLSLLGSGLILVYAILRKDPVLLVGHGFGFFIYIRNMHILKYETEG